MTEKERYVKQAFKNYKENKKQLRSISFDGVKTVDYSRPKVSESTFQGRENALIGYLNKKEKIERQIMIVERTIWYYELDGGEKAKYIRFRWIKGYPLYRVAMECYIANGTAVTWGKEILSTAARVADLFNLF